MKKTLALVLTVVMVMGLAMSAGAATSVVEASSSFVFGVVSSTATPTTANLDSKDLGTFESGKVIVLTNFALLDASGTEFSNWKIDSVTPDSGASFMKTEFKNDGTNMRNNIASVSLTNDTGSEVPVAFKITFVDKETGSKKEMNTFSVIYKAKIKSSVNNGTKYGQVDAAAQITDKETEYSINAGTGTGEYGVITAGAFGVLNGKSGSSLTVYGSGFEFNFKAGSVGSNISGDVDILGEKGVEAAFLKANDGLKEADLVGIKKIKANSTVNGTLKLDIDADFYNANKGKTLYVYDQTTGKLVSNVTAKWTDGYKIELSGNVVGSYVVSVAGNLKAIDGSSGTGTGSGKPNPGTGK